MKFNRNQVKKYLQSSDFTSLFIEELGWDYADISPIYLSVDEENSTLEYTLEAVAQKRGLIVYHCVAENGILPNAKTRKKIDTEVTSYNQEHLIIYTDENQSKQVWQWVKRESATKTKVKETTFNVTQSGELLTQKLEALFIDFAEEENLTLSDVTQRTQKAFDIEKVTKKFFDDFQLEHRKFVTFIQGIDNIKDANWYASVMEISDTWNLKLTREFDMTNDSHLFKTEPGKGRLPLYEGKMIWHFTHGLNDIRYWLDKETATEKLISPRITNINKLAKKVNLKIDTNSDNIKLGYQYYRLGIRTVTGATNERALVISVLPKNVVAGNSLMLSIPINDEIFNKKLAQKELYSSQQLLAIVSILSSFVCDWFIRQQILTNLNMFYIYQLPVPRLTEKDEYFNGIVERAAKLICTTPEYDELAKEVGLKSRSPLTPLEKGGTSKVPLIKGDLGGSNYGITEERERGKIRAELDGIIAHLYGLTETEFSHILSTFPIVAEEVKTAALNAYREMVK